MVYITVLRIASLPLEDFNLDIFFDNFFAGLYLNQPVKTLETVEEGDVKLSNL